MCSNNTDIPKSSTRVPLPVPTLYLSICLHPCCVFFHTVLHLKVIFFLHVFPGHSVGHRRPHDMEKAHAATGKRHGCIDYKAIKLKSNSKRNPLNLISRVQPRSMESPTVSTR